MNNRSMILIAGILLLAFHPALATTLFVATNGNDTKPGTEEKPFATLERARDEIRHIKSGGPLPVGGITVEVQDGVYELARPIELTDKDSGNENTPIVYRARRGEVVGDRWWTGGDGLATSHRSDHPQTSGPCRPRQGLSSRPQSPRHH